MTVGATLFYEGAGVTDISRRKEVGLLAALDALAHSPGRAEFGSDPYIVGSRKIFRDCAERLAQASRCEHGQLALFSVNQTGGHDHDSNGDADQKTHRSHPRLVQHPVCHSFTYFA
jgi:hypothetical protein